jgi:ribosomal protein L11 methyltransferase
MSWVELKCIVDSVHSEYLSELLQAQGALSVTFQPANNEPFFNEKSDHNGLCGRVFVSGLFLQKTDLTAVKASISLAVAESIDLNWDSVVVTEEDWVSQSQLQFKPLLINRKLWILPEEQQVENNSSEIVLKINPGLAFGAGTHPTTQLCLQWLIETPIKDKLICDFGCGSGILTVAAMLLGAKKVLAVDSDEKAIESTRHNAALNGLFEPEHFLLSLSGDFIPTTVDVIVSNIISGVLIEQQELFSSMLNHGSECVLSGIMPEHLTDVRRAYQKNFEEKSCIQQGEWLRVVWRKKH